ncbi:hypothetical protein JYU34_002202 [Plutella xylostella]|uniref:Uncharacterized protein n=1 Tax=Plutella xylostella TaxID=51655 RepID=A0ABQ7R1L6_PLUXY|nr:hypothetical protein JYU34_002202 [Plutella xylostella]
MYRQHSRPRLAPCPMHARALAYEKRSLRPLQGVTLADFRRSNGVVKGLRCPMQICDL